MSEIVFSMDRASMASMLSEDHRKKKNMSAAPETMASLVMSEQRMREKRPPAHWAKCSSGGLSVVALRGVSRGSMFPPTVPARVQGRLTVMENAPVMAQTGSPTSRRMLARLSGVTTEQTRAPSSSCTTTSAVSAPTMMRSTTP
ncbi:hypothetical protein DSECCO2_599470 [anaerobic digester metagenome]